MTGRQRAIVLLMLCGGCTDQARRIGDICKRNDDCSSGRCDERVCKSAVPVGVAGSCSHHLQCRSDRCFDGLCAQGVRPAGAACSDELQCQSGQCNLGVCQGDIDAGQDGTPDASPDGAPPDSQPDVATPDVVVPPDSTQNDSGPDSGVIWARRIGGALYDTAESIAVDPSGNVYATGRFQSTVDFGGKTLSSTASSADAFTASYSPDGVLRWCERYGGSTSDTGVAIALDSSSNAYLCGLINASSTPDLFVASYAGGDGALRWSKTYGGGGIDHCTGIAVNGANLFVTGDFADVIDLGGETHSSTGFSNIFVASYATLDGAHDWSKRWGSSANTYGGGLATDGKGSLYVTGYFSSTASFGGNSFTSMGHLDIFVASYADSDGAHRWSFRHGGIAEDQLRAVAVDSAGLIHVTGITFGSSDLGGGVMPSLGSIDAVVAGYRTSNGIHHWSGHFGGTTGGESWGHAVVAGPNHIYFAGDFQDTVNFGGSDLTSAGGRDIYIVSTTTNGVHRWSRRFGGAFDETCEGLAIDDQGHIYATGLFGSSTVDFGGHTLVNAGDADAYIFKLEQGQP